MVLVVRVAVISGHANVSSGRDGDGGSCLRRRVSKDVSHARSDRCYSKRTVVVSKSVIVLVTVGVKEAISISSILCGASQSALSHIRGPDTHRFVMVVSVKTVEVAVTAVVVVAPTLWNGQLKRKDAVLQRSLQSGQRKAVHRGGRYCCVGRDNPRCACRVRLDTRACGAKESRALPLELVEEGRQPSCIVWIGLCWLIPDSPMVWCLLASFVDCGCGRHRDGFGSKTCSGRELGDWRKRRGDNCRSCCR